MDLNTLSFTVGGTVFKLGQPLWKTVWSFLKSLKIKLPYDPAIPLLGISPIETKTRTRKNICTLMFVEVLFTLNAKQKTIKCLEKSIGENL